MKDSINEWLRMQARRTGVFALGVAHPDNTYAGQSCSSIYPSVFLNNSWRCLRETFDILRQEQQLEPLCIRWVYEHACLYAAQRPDGVVLGIYVSRDEQLVPRTEVEAILNEFLFLSHCPA